MAVLGHVGGELVSVTRELEPWNKKSGSHTEVWNPVMAAGVDEPGKTGRPVPTLWVPPAGDMEHGYRKNRRPGVEDW